VWALPKEARARRALQEHLTAKIQERDICAGAGSRVRGASLGSASCDGFETGTASGASPHDKRDCAHPRWRARQYARQSSLLAGVAANFAAPTLAAFPEGDSGDDEGGGRIGPPPTQKSVREQAEQQRDGEVRADHVLDALLHRG